MDAASQAVAQERLHELLRASTSVVEHLDLDAVLTAIVDAARSLAGARYGALGVIGRQDGLERFIHRGMPDDVVHELGHPPHGLGVLGAVIDERAPIRLEHLADDPRSVGFPAHHPPMDSFLGVPIRVRDAVYGNLYLTDAAAGAFTAEDEELVVALAATAGIAIENARLFAQARTREAWSAALADVLGALLDTTGDDALEIVVERVGPLLGARLTTIAVPLHGGRHLRVTAAHGEGADARRGRIHPARGSLEGRALESRQAAYVARPGAASSSQAPTQGPTVAIPLFSGDEPLGVLTIEREPGAPEFGETDLEMAFVFAGQAGVAIEVARGRDDRRRLDAAHRRGRVARDLHDHVIQRLYGAGLGLQSIAPDVAPDVIGEQLDTLDAAVREIRTIILSLAQGEGGGLRDRLLAMIAEASSDLEAPPRILFSGAIDVLVPAGLAGEIEALLRDAVTDAVAASAGQSPAREPLDIALTVDDVEVWLRLSGPGLTERLIDELRTRAAEIGGSVEAEAAASTITWRVPLTIRTTT
jgi:GAF domain-containing protein